MRHSQYQCQCRSGRRHRHIPAKQLCNKLIGLAGDAERLVQLCAELRIANAQNKLGLLAGLRLGQVDLKEVLQVVMDNACSTYHPSEHRTPRLNSTRKLAYPGAHYFDDAPTRSARFCSRIFANCRPQTFRDAVDVFQRKLRARERNEGLELYDLAEAGQVLDGLHSVGE
jgi:hypothetical protein